MNHIRYYCKVDIKRELHLRELPKGYSIKNVSGGGNHNPQKILWVGGPENFAILQVGGPENLVILQVGGKVRHRFK